MNHPIYTENPQCRDCCKCVSNCPCKAIRVENGKPGIIPQMCVLCGRCVVNCPSGAKRTRSDVGAVRELLKQKERVIVSLAPSFVTEFLPAGPRGVVDALKRLGFYAVSETSLGADLLSKETADALLLSRQDKNARKLFVSSACPAVVLYIRRYAPSFVPFLNNRASPLLAHAKLLRKLYGENIGVVFAGPCAAKKREADEFDEIDAALTFKELKEWLEEEKIAVSGAAGGNCFVPRRAAKGAYFPVDGGMITAVQKYMDDPAAAFTVSVSGMYMVIKTLRDVSIQTAGLDKPLFLELLACYGGCINGPCVTHGAGSITQGVRLTEYAESADDRLDATLLAHGLSLTGTVNAETVVPAFHTDWDIRKTLALIGKGDSANEINCAMCGYNSCRDFAIALMEGRAEKTMCLSYMRNLAQKKANALMHSIPSGVVLVSKNLTIIECNENFVRLLGPEPEELYGLVPGLAGANLSKIVSFSSYFSDVLESNIQIDMDIREEGKYFHLNVFVIEKNEIAAGVIYDMTAPEQQRERTVSRAKKIIEKNVETVQKIAFLLGENAAETESILNAIIDLNKAGEAKNDSAANAE
ncbi:MAG: PAS domain-containing protein [Spirochaetaceae bacterium]|jgi:iron only hydrogenase large subunit-like protein|nr:PAS domain-containing protein [Spirochaetaceae bacterium]